MMRPHGFMSGLSAACLGGLLQHSLTIGGAPRRLAIAKRRCQRQLDSEPFLNQAQST